MRSFAPMLARALPAAALLLLYPVAAAAQSDRYAPLVLQLPASPRALAMGDAWVAGRDADVIFYNPAQLGVVPGTDLSIGRYGSASTIGTLASTMALGSGGIGIGARFLDYGAAGVPPHRIGALAERGPAAASSLALTAGLSTTARGIRWGVAGNYVEERFAAGAGVAGRGAVDLGVARGVGPVTVGLAVQNLGADLRAGASRVQLPARASLGIGGGGIIAGPFDLAVAAQISVLRNGYAIPGGGIELGYSWLEGYTVALRAGARRAEEGAQRPFSVGAGVSADRLSLDYAFESFPGGRAEHRIGLRVR